MITLLFLAPDHPFIEHLHSTQMALNHVDLTSAFIFYFFLARGIPSYELILIHLHLLHLSQSGLAHLSFLAYFLPIVFSLFKIYALHVNFGHPNRPQHNYMQFW